MPMRLTQAHAFGPWALDIHSLILTPITKQILGRRRACRASSVEAAAPAAARLVLAQHAPCWTLSSRDLARRS
jgi:hypothetical protein